MTEELRMDCSRREEGKHPCPASCLLLGYLQQVLYPVRYLALQEFAGTCSAVWSSSRYCIRCYSDEGTSFSLFWYRKYAAACRPPHITVPCAALMAFFSKF